MNIIEVLSHIQKELNAPKNKWNEFGGYYSRSAEDILEAVKPICSKYNAVIRLTDTVEEHQQGDYISATVILQTADSLIESKAQARIPLSKKKLDDSQVTGSASSYARKYALCGLLAIDDNKDPDQLPPEPAPEPEKNICTQCGKEIKGARKNGKTLTAQEVSKQCGGLCISCYKAAKAEASNNGI